MQRKRMLEYNIMDIAFASFDILGKQWKRNIVFMIFVKCVTALRYRFVYTIFILLS
jgi:hypothetical protein